MRPSQNVMRTRRSWRHSSCIKWSMRESELRTANCELRKRKEFHMSPTSKPLHPRSEFENMPGSLGPTETERKTSPSDLGARAGEKAEELASAAGQKAVAVAEKAKEMARDASNTAGDLAKNVGHKAQQAGPSVSVPTQSFTRPIRVNTPPPIRPLT